MNIRKDELRMRQYLNHYLQLKPSLSCEFTYTTVGDNKNSSFICEIVMNNGDVFCSAAMFTKADACDGACMRALDAMLTSVKKEFKVGLDHDISSEFDQKANYVGMLQEYIQNIGGVIPVYTSMKGGTKHVPTFVCSVMVDNRCFSSKVCSTIKQGKHNSAHMCLLDLQMRGLLKGHLRSLLTADMLYKLNDARAKHVAKEQEFAQSEKQRMFRAAVGCSDVEVARVFKSGEVISTFDGTIQANAVYELLDGSLMTDELPIQEDVYDDGASEFAAGDFDEKKEYLAKLRSVCLRRFGDIPTFQCTRLGPQNSSYCQVLTTLGDERMIENSFSDSVEIAIQRASWAFMKFLPAKMKVEINSVVVLDMTTRPQESLVKQAIGVVSSYDANSQDVIFGGMAADICGKERVIGQGMLTSIPGTVKLLGLGVSVWNRIISYLTHKQRFLCRAICTQLYHWLDYDCYWVSLMDFVSKDIYKLYASRRVKIKDFTLGFDFRAFHILFEKEINAYYWKRLNGLVRGEDKRVEITISDISTYEDGLIEQNVCGITTMKRGTVLHVMYYDNESVRAKADSCRNTRNGNKPYMVRRPIMAGKCDTFWITLRCEATLRSYFNEWFRSMGGAYEVTYVKDPYARTYCPVMMFVVHGAGKLIEVGCESY